MVINVALQATHSFLFYFWFCPQDDSFDMARNGAEGEEEEEEDDMDLTEVQRRKERLEREQWLREQVSLWGFSSFVLYVTGFHIPISVYTIQP